MAFTDATVGFAESEVNVIEGEILQVCVVLSDIPSGGLACDITVTLSAELYDGDGKQGLSCNYLL